MQLTPEAAEQLAEQLYHRNQEFEVKQEDRLSDQERGSATWKKVSEFLQENISVLQSLNEQDLPATETANVRGQLKMAKKILSLGDDSDPLGTNDELDDPDLGY